MATTLNLKETEACVKVVRILEENCDYNTLVELQEVLLENTDDLVNWLQEVIDKKRKDELKK